MYEFAKDWVEKGHEVIVVSSIYSKSDLKATKFIETQIIEGIKVKVLNITIDNKQPILKRIWSFIQYAFVSSWYALTIKCDIVIASSGPITVGLPGLIAHYLRGRKLVFETRDLWPEGAIEMGMIKNPIFIKMAYWFEKRCYKASSLIVSLSPGMKSYIEQNHRHKNVISITNAANIQLFSTSVKFPHSFDTIKPYKYAIYTGNIGEVNNSYWLYNAAKELKKRGREDIIILLIGEGQQKENLKKLALQENINNFFIWELMPKENLIPIIQHAIVSLVPLKGTPVLDTSSPNKFFESLAAGVPVIQNTNGWMKDFLTEHKLGFTIDPNSPEILVDKLIELDKNPNVRIDIKERAIHIAKENFDKDKLADQMLKAIEKLVK